MESRLQTLERKIDRIQLDIEPDPTEPRQELDPHLPREPADLVVDRILLYYRDEVKYSEDAPERPLWHLVQDMQRQAMVYTNIIDQLKAGEEPADIKRRFEDLHLVPVGTLPNPDGLRLLNRALDKIERYRKALIDIVKRHGRTLVFDDLEFARELSPSVALEIGFPPSISIGVEFSGR
jgi:hypothetical protein